MRRSLAALAVVIAACAPGAPPLPELFPVPAASLVDENGAAVSLDRFKGSVTVYDFIFTKCNGPCPIMSNNMRRLTSKVPKDAPVRFVSISIDPEHDTPAVLRDYAKRVRNDDRWTFLTGNLATVLDLSVNGFKLGAENKPGQPIVHSVRFAVADRNGVIREYYSGVDNDSAEHVAATVATLLAE